MNQLDGTGMKRLHREWRRQTSGRIALILDGVSNPFNVGAIVRTAAAEQIDHIWIAGGTSPNHKKVNKTALGTIRYLSWDEVDDGLAAVASAKAAGYQVIALELTTAALPLPYVELASDVALVVGHEERGITSSTIGECDEVAFIPQTGKVGSLNVAAATAIAIYEARRRCWSG